MKLENLIESGKYSEPYLEEGILYEAGLSRVWQHTKEPFAIMTAFRDNFSLKQNRQRNRKLEQELKSQRAGGIKLIGHWEEAPDGMDWKEAKKVGRVEDVVEESYFIPMPKHMDYEEFKNFILQLIRKFNQDAALIGDDSKAQLLFKNGSTESIGKIAFDKVGQAYSQLRNNKVPFIFEGTIQPSSNFHRMALKKRGVRWFSETD